jgi:hypothetical protein
MICSSIAIDGVPVYKCMSCSLQADVKQQANVAAVLVYDNGPFACLAHARMHPSWIDL